jgi:hypothetical protein
LNTSPAATAHSLYALYETLPEDVQQSFLQELVQKKLTDIEALARTNVAQINTQSKVILGIMEDAFKVPDDFDSPLSEVLLSEFYSNQL